MQLSHRPDKISDETLSKYRDYAFQDGSTNMYVIYSRYPINIFNIVEYILYNF